MLQEPEDWYEVSLIFFSVFFFLFVCFCMKRSITKFSCPFSKNSSACSFFTNFVLQYVSVHFKFRGGVII